MNGATDRFERSLQALIDGRSPADVELTNEPSDAALLALHAIARCCRLALFGADIPADRPAGARWGHLEVRGEIGRGAAGTVYRAWDSSLAREVALKLIDAASPDRDRALEEGRLLARLNHAHIVRVFGADQIDGVTGIWMELVEGETLDERLEQDGVMGSEEALLAGVDLCRALTAVHAAGLVHGDVKSRNVLCERGGRLVLMDLGAGRPAALAAAEAGTPLYMSPEVLAGAPPDARSDVYALGVLLYRLLTGRFPVTGATLADLREAHRLGRRTALRDARPDIGSTVVSAIERAADVDPNRRYPTAAECEASLREALRHELGRRTFVPATIVRRLVRRRVLLGAVALAMSVTAIGLWSGWNTSPIRHARRQLGLAVAPRSPLYLTVGGGLVILRDGHPELFSGNPLGAGAIVASTGRGVRTATMVPPFTGDAAYSLAGRGVSPAAGVSTDRWCCTGDGTTDGAFNYAARQDSTLMEPVTRPLAPPAVYRFDRDWSHPRMAFALTPAGLYAGITFCRQTRTFFLTRNADGRGVIEEWSPEGKQLRTLVDAAGTTWLGIAADPADGTLWVIQDQYPGALTRIRNLDTSGRTLGSFEWAWPMMPLRAGGAEFAWQDDR